MHFESNALIELLEKSILQLHYKQTEKLNVNLKLFLAPMFPLSCACVRAYTCSEMSAHKKTWERT